MPMSLSRRTLLGAAALMPLTGAHAQFRVEVSGVGLTQLPFSIAPFKGADALPQDLVAIVKADLERSGQFRHVNPVVGMLLDETSRPDLAPGVIALPMCCLQAVCPVWPMAGTMCAFGCGM